MCLAPWGETRQGESGRGLHAIRRCLHKNPEERWQNVGDLSQELRWVQTSGQRRSVFSAWIGKPTAGAPQARRRRRLVIQFTIGISLSVLAVALWVPRGSSPSSVADSSVADGYAVQQTPARPAEKVVPATTTVPATAPIPNSPRRYGKHKVPAITVPAAAGSIYMPPCCASSESVMPPRLEPAQTSADVSMVCPYCHTRFTVKVNQPLAQNETCKCLQCWSTLSRDDVVRASRDAHPRAPRRPPTPAPRIRLHFEAGYVTNYAPLDQDTDAVMNPVADPMQCPSAWTDGAPVTRHT